MITTLPIERRHSDKKEILPNYKAIDQYLSRSAQPTPEGFFSLKSAGVTDIVNFRTTGAQDFDEKSVVQSLGMKYHPIPFESKKPNNYCVKKFFTLVDKIRNSNGTKKLHIHCRAGADRTGLMSLLYKTKYSLGTYRENVDEMISMGYNFYKHPNLLVFAKKIMKKQMQNVKFK